MIDFEKVLTAKEASEILNVSHKMVLKMCAINPNNGGIPSFKVGSCVRIKESDLQKWIEEQKRWR